jgi:transcriptional regulator with XRE-family HTH domain
MNAYPIRDKRLDGLMDATATFLLSHVRTRIARGASLAVVGRELGVSKQAVHQWLTGETTPRGAVLLLASLLYRAPVDLAPGLPVGPGDAGG